MMQMQLTKIKNKISADCLFVKESTGGGDTEWTQSRDSLPHAKIPDLYHEFQANGKKEDTVKMINVLGEY